MQLMAKFPTDDAAREWFESESWPEGPECPLCGTRNIQCGIKDQDSNQIATKARPRRDQGTGRGDDR